MVLKPLRKGKSGLIHSLSNQKSLNSIFDAVSIDELHHIYDYKTTNSAEDVLVLAHESIS